MEGNDMTQNQLRHSKRAWRWTIVGICVLIIAVVIALVILNIAPGKNVKTYSECKDAGGAIAESLPEQCVINGKTYSKGSTGGGTKTDTSDPNAYIGLTEEAALEKAENEKKAARVVKRDGQDLPVTMDFSKGRLNFTVNNGKVEKVEVEGE